VLCAADELPLATLNVEVPAWGAIDLGEIDLSQRMPTLEIRAVKRDGSPANVSGVRRVDGEGSTELPKGSQSPLIVTRPPDGAEIELSAEGCMPLRAVVTGPLLEVVFEAVTPARLVLPPGLRVPTQRLPVVFSFERLSGDPGQSTTPLLTIEARSEYSALLGAPGRFRLSAMDVSKPSALRFEPKDLGNSKCATSTSNRTSPWNCPSTPMPGWSCSSTRTHKASWQSCRTLALFSHGPKDPWNHSSCLQRWWF